MKNTLILQSARKDLTSAQEEVRKLTISRDKAVENFSSTQKQLEAKELVRHRIPVPRALLHGNLIYLLTEHFPASTECRFSKGGTERGKDHNS